MTALTMMCCMNFFLINDSELLCIIIAIRILRIKFKMLFGFLPIMEEMAEMN